MELHHLHSTSLERLDKILGECLVGPERHFCILIGNERLYVVFNQLKHLIEYPFKLLLGGFALYLS